MKKFDNLSSSHPDTAQEYMQSDLKKNIGKLCKYFELYDVSKTFVLPANIDFQLFIHVCWNMKIRMNKIIITEIIGSNFFRWDFIRICHSSSSFLKDGVSFINKVILSYLFWFSYLSKHLKIGNEFASSVIQMLTRLSTVLSWGFFLKRHKVNNINIIYFLNISCVKKQACPSSL